MQRPENSGTTAESGGCLPGGIASVLKVHGAQIHGRCTCQRRRSAGENQSFKVNFSKTQRNPPGKIHKIHLSPLSRQAWSSEVADLQMKKSNALGQLCIDGSKVVDVPRNHSWAKWPSMLTRFSQKSKNCSQGRRESKVCCNQLITIKNYSGIQRYIR